MTAGHFAGAQTGSAQQSPSGAAVLDGCGQPPRVVSVSAHHAGAARATQPPAQAGEVFVTPRVINQRSFDTLAARLRSLLEDAVQADAALTRRLGSCDQVHADIAAATSALQDRLRLGARMLKAFQGQIDRIDAARQEAEARQAETAETERRLQQTVAEFEARAAAAIGEIEALRHREVAPTWEAACKPAAVPPASRETDLGAVMQRLDALLRRLGPADGPEGAGGAAAGALTEPKPATA